MEVKIKPQGVRYETYIFDKNQVLDLGNPADIEFINSSENSRVRINNLIYLCTKEDFDTNPSDFPVNWQHKFNCYPNEYNLTQWNIKFEDFTNPAGKKIKRRLVVICKYYVYN